MEFNHPLVVRKSAAHAGKLPQTWGLAAISPANVILTALSPGKDGTTTLRLYEADGRMARTDVRIAFNASVGGVRVVNLLEDSIHQARVRGRVAELALRPYEIQTIQVKLSSPR